jgi:propionate CoA-transferase
MIPMEARFSYDQWRNMFFLNMEGMSLMNRDDVEEIRAEVSRRLSPIGDKVHMIVNHDYFFVAPAAAQDYDLAVRWLSEHYYASATRYTSSSFRRLQHGGPSPRGRRI